MRNMADMVKVEHLKKNFGDLEVLKDINLTVAEGEKLVIIGPSGSGKSTFIRCINHLEEPTSGTISIAGTPVTKKNRLEMAKKYSSMVFQQFNLYPHLTVLENLTLAPVKLQHVPKDKARETALKCLDRVGLKAKAGNYPAQLSGGQQQRVALARILVYEPDVIMLDEPFSALDYYLKEQLQFQVREVLRGYTGDVLMVSHSRDEVYRFCEKSIILNRGQVAMKGETRAIFQKPENVTAARLTGCKNFSRIRRIGEYEVEALDWGLTFQTEEAVAAEHAYIGIRAHQFYPARGSANEFTCEWGDTLCQPFEWDVLLRPVENAGAAGDKENALEREVIWWKVDYKQSDSLNQYQRGDRVRLGIAPGDIMLLKEG